MQVVYIKKLLEEQQNEASEDSQENRPGAELGKFVVDNNVLMERSFGETLH